MVSSRKSRVANKRLSKLNEESPEKNGGNSNKNKRKRKLSDMLGSQWSKEELERFYGAYRKYGKDWKKVAVAVRNRSVDMVTALYNMNKAYLSLPEGTASLAGLIAMMTDHYNILEGSDSDQESNDGIPVSWKPQKRGRGNSKLNNISKGLDESFPDLLRYQSAASNNGCLSLLKKKRSGGSRPRAVGKRTPRFPVSYGNDGIGQISKHNPKSEFDSDNFDAARAALALAEASKRGGSPQVSSAPSKRTTSIPHSRRKGGAEFGIVKVRGAATDEDCNEDSLGSRGAENGDVSRDEEGVGAVDRSWKGKTFQSKRPKIRNCEKNNDFDDVKEACSGTEEGLAYRAIEDEVEAEVTNTKVWHSPQVSRRRSRQLFSGDESTALDALQALADVSLNILAPTSTAESESSVQVKEENMDIDEKLQSPEVLSAHLKRDKAKKFGKKDKLHEGRESIAPKNAKTKTSVVDVTSVFESKQQGALSANKSWKRKRKILGAKIPKTEIDTEPILAEPLMSELLKQGKSAKQLEHSSSTEMDKAEAELGELSVLKSLVNHGNLPSKRISRRKMHLQKVLAQKGTKPTETVGGESADKCLHISDRAADFKNKLAHCLASPLLRRWCAFEWFYSAIDLPWFAKNEFVEYLNHAKLGSLPPRLTRAEWGVIRSALGKPRRLSEQLLREERRKLEEYREHVRKTYAELRSGVREGLPTDLARPLSVGQRVIAWHPKTRELHDGSVLTVDRNKCRIQFDKQQLGVELVMDIDCMPLNPLENLPKALRMQNFAFSRIHENYCEMKVDSQLRDWKNGGSSIKCASSENLGSLTTVSDYFNILMRQAKGMTIDSVLHAKATLNDVLAAQAAYGPCQTLAQIQARDADKKALSDLSRFLDKKETLLTEMKNLHEEVPFSQNQRSNFREYHAKVHKQIKNVDDQVSYALDFLKDRSTFSTNGISPLVSKLGNNTGALAGIPALLDQSALFNQDMGSHVAEVYDSSRGKARTMVDIEVRSALREGKLTFKVGEDDYKSIEALKADPAAPATGLSAADAPVSAAPGSPADQDQTTSCPSDVAPCDTKQNNSYIGNEIQSQVPLELMSSCVATLLMIQTCTEQQHPPGEVAQILDSAVTSLHPCCPENLPLYRDIEQCMGLIKTQVLALIPTQSN